MLGDRYNEEANNVTETESIYRSYSLGCNGTATLFDLEKPPYQRRGLGSCVVAPLNLCAGGFKSPS